MLKNKTAVVTGGGGALGRAVVADLLKAGADVHVPCFNAEEQQDLQKQHPGLRTALCDLSNEAQAQEYFGKQIPQKLDFLACMAGGFSWSPLADADGAALNKMLDMNLRSLYHSIHCALPLLRKAGSGRIVTVGAMPAQFTGGANMAAYTASKSAVLGLTRSLAEELRSDRITVNAIVPTIIDTPANRSAMPDADRSDWLPPAEIAQVVRFLLSPAARTVSGAALTLSL